MRMPSLSVLVGIVLLIVGAFVLVEGGYISTRREVIDIGGLKVSAEERRPIRPWVAGLALVAGTALVLVGLGRRR